MATGGLTEHSEHHVLNPHGKGFVLCRDRPAAKTQDNAVRNRTLKNKKKSVLRGQRVPEYHHERGGLGEGGHEAGDRKQDHEGQQQVGASTSTGPRGGEAQTTHTLTVREILHTHTRAHLILRCKKTEYLNLIWWC